MHLSGPVPQQAAYGAAVNEPRQRGVDPDVAENFTQMRSCADGCGRHCPGRMWQRGIGASRRDSPTSNSAVGMPTSPSTSVGSSSAPTESPGEPITSDVGDCFGGQCRLEVLGPTAIPLDANRFHYESIAVVAVTSSSLTYQVPYPTGGHAEQTLGVGGSGSFGFRGQDSISVRLESIDSGHAVLSLVPGPPL